MRVEVLAPREDVIHDARQRKDVGRRPRHAVRNEALLRGHIADGPDGEISKRAAHALGARHAKIGDLEDLGGTEAAAEHVPGCQIAVDDADRVNRGQPRTETAHGMSGAHRIEGVAGAMDRVGDAIVERGSLGAPVHVLDGEPRGGDVARELGAARVNQAYDERCRRYALVEPSERDSLFERIELRRDDASAGLGHDGLDHDG
jgi:hypothetical protein